MLMDVGHRLLCSLRQVDSRRWSFSCSPPRTFPFTAHSNSHNANMDISSRYYWHGSQNGVNDEKLMNVLGDILRFGAVLNCCRSWVSSSEYVAVRCMSHKSMAFASTEARDGHGLTVNDGCDFSQINGDELLISSPKHGEEILLPELSGQLENVELSHALWQDSIPEEHSLPSDLPESSLATAACLTDVVVIVFDIETTGFKLSDDRIIEFAARDLAGGDCSTIQTLVNPERPVPSYASNVHGIHSNMVNKSSIPRWNEVAPVLTQFVESRRISGAPVFLVAHNGRKFDVPFLLKEFERCSLEMPSWWQFIDSVPIAREVMKAKGEKGSLRLSALHEYYRLPYAGDAHRAMVDVHMLASVLQMLLIELQMPVSEFLKKAFTTKDILRSSSSSENFESLSQEFDLGNEAEELSEVPCGRAVTMENFGIPWDGIEAEGEDEGSIMLQDIDSKQEEEDEYDPDMNSFQERDKEPIDINVSTYDSSIPNLSSSKSGGFDSCFDSSNDVKPTDSESHHTSSALKEYLVKKSQRPDFLHLLRAGEFYQAFFEDAKKLSELCGIALCVVQADEILDGLVPMATLCSKEYILHALCLQAEGVCVYKQDRTGRLVNDALAPPFAISSSMPRIARALKKLDGSLGSFFVAVVPPRKEDGLWGLAYSDISTGMISAIEGHGQRSILEEIANLNPCEIFFPDNGRGKTLSLSAPGFLMDYSYSFRPSRQFSSEYCMKNLQKLVELQEHEHEQSALASSHVAVSAVGGLLGFCEEIQSSMTGNLTFHKLTFYHRHDYMLLDQCTQSCLEVFQNKRQGGKKGSLFWALDHTMTSVGKRILRQWLLRPLLDEALICARQNTVEVFLQTPELREQVRQELKLLNDLERLSLKIVSDDHCPWTLLALGQSIGILQTLRSRFEGHLSPYFLALTCPTSLYDLGKKIQNCFEIRTSSILQHGLIIKSDADETLYELRKEIHNLDACLRTYERLEQDRTGIPSLKFVQNESGDCFISIKKTALEDTSLPADYQLYTLETLEDAFSYVSFSLIKQNNRRSELMEKLRHKESSILDSLRVEICAFIKPLQILSQAVAAIDVLATFAEVASLRQYCKPSVVSNCREIKVKDGRHAFYELLVPRASFYANSLLMGYNPETNEQTISSPPYIDDFDMACSKQHRHCPDVVVLTGPPASGKSGYLQQAGLIQILAQIGSYVPAKEAVLGITDAIFMKVDPSAGLSTSKSSLEIDMVECARILKDATEHSLILLDGIDRSLSLNLDNAFVRAIVEFLAQDVKARTMLITQNSTLSSLQMEFCNIANFQCMSNDDPVFPFRVKPGFFSGVICDFPT